MRPDCLWRDPPQGLALVKDEVHVFRASLDLPVEQAEILELTLSSDEMARAGRFRFEKDRKKFVVARGLLRTLLGRYLKADPRSIHFKYGPHGKPAVGSPVEAGYPGFNISHSHGLCLLAFSLRREVGIDIEYIRPTRHDDEHISRRFFRPAESASLDALPSHLRQRAFFTFWTRKEAYLKARGSGVMTGLNRCDVSRTPDEHTGMVEVREDEGTSGWTVVDLDAGPSYAAAVAAEGPEWRLKCWEWEG